MILAKPIAIFFSFGDGENRHFKSKNQAETGRGSRVVNRSNNNANTNGGVAYVNSNNAPSNTNANIGSRLAHRKNFKRSSQPKDEKIAGQRLCIAITLQPVEPYQAFHKPRGYVRFSRTTQ